MCQAKFRFVNLIRLHAYVFRSNKIDSMIKDIEINFQLSKEMRKM